MEEVGKILPSLLARHMHRGTPRLVELLTPLWPQVVGKGIARHSRPVAFVSGTLTLATACPTWAAQLGQMNEDVRAEINSFLGAPLVRKLRVRHMPDLVLETETGKSEAGNGRPETRTSRVGGADSRCTFEVAGLDPRIGHVAQGSFSKYFSKAANRPLAGHEE